MKSTILLLAVAATLLGVCRSELQCTSGGINSIKDFPKDWINITQACNKAMTDQVEVEFTAAMTYMAMGAHFSRDTINRPGFSDYFFKSASEEREHGIKILHYLLMRGKLTGDDQDVNNINSDVLDSVIKNPKPNKLVWSSGLEALKDALLLETSVTEHIKSIIAVCEDPEDGKGNKLNVNDYHLSDYLTGEFLTEQYEGQRQLAGMISTLGKLMVSHKDIGEFLFDKQIAA